VVEVKTILKVQDANDFFAKFRPHDFGAVGSTLN